jgi:hypothetical protein
VRNKREKVTCHRRFDADGAPRQNRQNDAHFYIRGRYSTVILIVEALCKSRTGDRMAVCRDCSSTRD